MIFRLVFCLVEIHFTVKALNYYVCLTPYFYTLPGQSYLSCVLDLQDEKDQNRSWQAVPAVDNRALHSRADQQT